MDLIEHMRAEFSSDVCGKKKDDGFANAVNTIKNGV
jgi:hypothetical protein